MDMWDKMRITSYPYPIPELYALENFNPEDFHLIIFDRKMRKWRVDGFFKHDEIKTLLGEKIFVGVESNRRTITPRVIFIRNDELEAVFKLHII